MPAWAKAAMEPAHFAFLDLLLELCAVFGWSVDHCLDMPVRRFWQTVSWLRRRNEQRAEAVRENPLGALALYGDG